LGHPRWIAKSLPSALPGPSPGFVDSGQLLDERGGQLVAATMSAGR